jgi:hypothetical protein
MITIREIIALCKIKQLKNCRFISGDSANVSIQVDENSNPFFDQPSVKDANMNLFSLTKEEIERIDNENDYYFSDVWDEMRKEEEEQT